MFTRRKLEDWEDKNVFESYLKRIDCTENDYYKVIQKCVSWDNLLEMDSFAEYVMAFMEEPMYRDMNEKYNDGKMELAEFEEWRLRTIFEKIHDLEKEKLMYFALTYKQRTLFVSMPSETKEQERFLGYGVICRDRYILRQSESGSIKNRMEIRHDLQFSIFIQFQLHGYATHFI